MLLPEQKDKFLNSLVSKPNRSLVLVGLDDFGSEIDEFLFLSVLDEFEQRGFISIENGFTDSRRYISIGIKADAFIQRGGYKFEEDIFRNNFTKLELELAKLEGEIPQERFNNIMTLISAASAAVSAFASIK